VKYLLDFVSKYGFAPFAYWRIVVGTVGLIGLFVYTPPSSNTAATETPSLNAEKMLEEALDEPASDEINFQAAAPLKPSSSSNQVEAETTIQKHRRHPDWQLGKKSDPFSR